MTHFKFYGTLYTPGILYKTSFHVSSAKSPANGDRVEEPRRPAKGRHTYEDYKKKKTSWNNSNRVLVIQRQGEWQITESAKILLSALQLMSINQIST